jgi:arsenite methyltransferase
MADHLDAPKKTEEMMAFELQILKDRLILLFRHLYLKLESPNTKVIISDLVTDKEIQDIDSVNPEKWCSCIDGALTKENYLQSISSAGFKNVNVLEERSYIEPDAADGRKISSLVIKAVRD